MASTQQLDLLEGQMTLGELESHLLEAANILRGPIDQADFKSYIFPLLFFKRISDVYQEEFQQALVDFDGDEQAARFAENHRFQIPVQHSWEAVRSSAKSSGQALSEALRAIETANQDSLWGIFGDAPWTNKERISDDVITSLIEHFSARFLGNSAVEPDMLGQAYEYLIKRFADLSNRKAGEFYTPRNVVKLLVAILNPQPGETVYDPACGTGGMLIEVVQHAIEAGINPAELGGTLFGQEKNLTTAGIARMNMILHSIEDFEIARGDTLRKPAFIEGNRLRTFDCVIANPPFSLRAWGREVWTKDPYGRAFAGLPPESSGDWAWVQHMMSSMRPGSGRVAVVLPQGALFRGGEEGKIRRNIVESGKIEAVITLGGQLFYGTGLAPCILVIRHTPPNPKKILFVDASDQFTKGRAQATMDSHHITQVLAWYRDFRDELGRVKAADVADVIKNDHNLNVSLYLESRASAGLASMPEALAELRAAFDALTVAESRLRKELASW
ncbi:class I SAM-dependent DNA methyltransferase [Nonomuraea roseoviolacea]|uniref:type I restriction-modification system subunit M n=1 Tax=Nonomuraea roseoviolacea TaxID=103837 RepID=UPI0031D22B4F